MLEVWCYGELLKCCAVLAADPDNEKVLERKVRTLCQMGKFQRAFALASHWLQKCPEVSETLQVLEKHLK